MQHIALAKVKYVQTQILMRAIFASEKVLRAAQSGVCQYMILDAGFDSFAFTHARDDLGIQVF